MKLDERGRGKFKPAPNLSLDEIQKVLLEKIKVETSLIIENEADIKLLEKLDYQEDKFDVVSLFSGCGGLDLGFELAGLASVIGENAAMEAFKDKNLYSAIRHKSIFHTIWANDLFREANQTYRANSNDTVLIQEMDIKKIKYFPAGNIVLGGFPCPGFSEAGPRLIDDERNFLYIHFIRCLVQTQPKVFVAENVKGMMTLGKGEVLKQIIEDFATAGYNVQFKLLNARDFGVPQLRERVLIIGVRDDLDFDYQYPTPTHGQKDGLKPFVTLKDAIGDLRQDPGPYFTGSFSTIYMSRNRKKEWDDQSFTIQASGRQAPLHPDGPSMIKHNQNKWELPGGEEQNRRLSVKEIARIQTFPDWYQFSDGGNEHLSVNGKLDKIYKQVGNAVPVLLAKAVAQPIADWAYQCLIKNKEQPAQEMLQTEHYQNISPQAEQFYVDEKSAV